MTAAGRSIANLVVREVAPGRGVKAGAVELASQEPLAPFGLMWVGAGLAEFDQERMRRLWRQVQGSASWVGEVGALMESSRPSSASSVDGWAEKR